MKRKFRSSVFVCQIIVALVFLLLDTDSAKAQCTAEQIHELLPQNGGYHFGLSVGISGNRAIVGSETFEGGGLLGSAHLFDTTSGQYLIELQSNDNAIDDLFSRCVAIDGAIAIVGAHWDDDNGDNSGSAYLFDTTTGQQIAKLLPDDGAAEDWFGRNVAISGAIAIVGAYRDDDNGDNSGSAYVFDTTTGQQIAKLLPDDGAADDRFGISVAISGNIAIVGAYRDDDNGDNSGSAYVFDAKAGQQLAKLLPNDGEEGDQFGRSVSNEGATVIVGADKDGDNGDGSGSAYVFDASTGQQLAKLLPDEGAAGDNFGISVSISGAIAIIGAQYDDENGDDSGSAYLFDTTTAQQIDKLLPDDGTAHRFGFSVAKHGNTAIVGAWGVLNPNSGSAYVFDVSCSDTITADQYTVFRGFHVGGDLSDTFESDDSRILFNPGFTINSNEAPVWLIFDGTLPSDSPASLLVVMESNAGTPGITHTLEAWNWTTAAYDVFDVSAASFNDDVVVTVDLSSGISDYAQAGTGAVRTRVGWRKTGPTINYPWEVRLDQIVWIVQ